MRGRRVLPIVGLVLLAIVIARPLSADVRILAHRSDDRSPHRIAAAIDMGVLALSLLITWTDRAKRP